MKKRGISPLIATVLIIGFTIVIGSLLMIWGSDIINKIKGETESEALAKLTCATKVKINIKQACIFGDKLKVKIENVGQQKISSLLFRVEGTKGSDLRKVDNGISVFGLNNFNTDFDVNTFSGVGEPTAVSVFPKISIDDVEQVCDSIKKEIKPCYPLPKITKETEDWVYVGGNAGIVLSEELKSLSLSASTEYALLLNAVEQGEKAIVKSNNFIIPDLADTSLRLHLRGSLFSTTAPQIELRKKNDELIKVIPTFSGSGTFDKPILINENEAGIEAYLYVSIENGAMALSEFCYTEGVDCVI